MPYTVTIHRDNETQLYSQTVENLDLKAVIETVNIVPPPAPQKRNRRKDAGKPRAPKPEAVPA